jgi:hypothetical protein
MTKQAGTNDTTVRLKLSDIGQRSGRKKLTAARAALTLAVLSALLLITARPVQAQGNNILTNGDFSKGLACYVDNGGNIGPQNPSTYDFYLSTDANSPPYAAELVCNGTAANCKKYPLSIFTGQIPVTTGKSYLLQVSTKCPSTGSGYIYAPKTTRGAIKQALTCNGSWNISKIAFTPAATSSTFRVAAYNTSPEPLLVDDLVITYSDGTVPSQNPWLYPGARDVSISPTTVSVDGNPYLALGIYDVPYANYAQVAAMGANTLIGDFAGPTSDCFLTGGEDILDRAYELGLNLIPDSSYTARTGLDNGTLSANGGGGVAALPNLVARYAPHLANIGWFLDDEPDQNGVNWYYILPDALLEEYGAVRSGTSLPILSDFQHASFDVPAFDAPYNGSADIWMAEPYGASFTGVTNAIATLEGIQQRPIWLFENNISSTLIVPKAYWSIVNGATGIIYYNWTTISASPAGLAAVGQTFSELGSLQSAIFGENFAVTPPSGVTAIGRQSQGTTYILAVNPKAKSVTGSFSIPGLAAGTTVTVQFENRTITASSGGFNDTFGGIARHVYTFQQ